ncbi:MAG: hypothetical protein Q4C61_15585 [Lachnospiraceae bacterium]|nr:hypothetical protein [Lachnospiraceae bacterium]
MYDDDMYGNDMHRQYRPRNSMARASFTLGILSLMFCSIFYIALPCGALAILCALLSRTGSSLSGRCKFAIVSGLCGMIATLIITGMLVQRVFSDAGLRSYLEYYLQSYTGDYSLDLEEELADIFPFLGDSFGQDGGRAEDSREAAPKDSLPDNALPEDDFSNDDPVKDAPNSQNGEGIFL